MIVIGFLLRIDYLKIADQVSPLFQYFKHIILCFNTYNILSPSVAQLKRGKNNIQM